MGRPQSFRVGSEAINSIRELNGDIYVSQTDPSDRAPTGYDGATRGVITNAGGAWHLLQMNSSDGSFDENNIEHMFDTASLGPNDLWVFGARCLSGCDNDAGSAFHSTDGGKTWTLAYDDRSTDGGNGFERYYWGATLNNHVYSQADSTEPPTAMRDYDGKTKTVSTVGASSQRPCPTMKANEVVTFDSRIVCASSGASSLNIFDGSKVTTKRYNQNNEAVRDFYVGDDKKLYILGAQGSIYRTASLSDTFEYLGNAVQSIGSDVYSILVHDGQIYIGGEAGKIYKSTTAIADMPVLTPEISSVSPAKWTYATQTRTVTVTGKDLVTAKTLTVDGQEFAVTSASQTTAMTTVDMAKLTKPSTLVETSDPVQAPTGRQVRKTYTANYDVAITLDNGQTASKPDAITTQFIESVVEPVEPPAVVEPPVVSRQPKASQVPPAGPLAATNVSTQLSYA